jgi:hypothetical protein
MVEAGHGVGPSGLPIASALPFQSPSQSQSQSQSQPLLSVNSNHNINSSGNSSGNNNVNMGLNAYAAGPAQNQMSLSPKENQLNNHHHQNQNPQYFGPGGSGGGGGGGSRNSPNTAGACYGGTGTGTGPMMMMGVGHSNSGSNANVNASANYHSSGNLSSNANYPQNGSNGANGDSSGGNSASLLSLPNLLLGQQNVPFFELNENNEYGNGCVLRFNMTFPIKDTALSGGPAVFKGSLTSARGTDDVAVYVWRRVGGINTEMMKKELKTLRILSQASGGCSGGGMIAKILHKGTIDIRYPTNTGAELSCIVTEYSDFGTLDRHLLSFCQVHPEGFSVTDIQATAAQLVETLLRCHSMRVTHRDIRPSNILVSRGEKFQGRQITGGFVLKLTGFRRAALAGVGLDGELDQWTAPEVSDTESRAKGGDNNYLPASDVWSLGLVLYFVASGGQCPFESFRQARESILEAKLRKECLEKHGLQRKSPILFDLIERMIRPESTRISLSLARCHPFLWTTSDKKSFLIDFASATANACHASSAAGGAGAGAGGGMGLGLGSSSVAESVLSFTSTLDRYSPHYVFGTDGWVAQLSADIAPHVEPPSLKTDFWWSCTHLLQAIKNQLTNPQRLAATVYPRLLPNQMLVAYLHQIVEVDFPRLLILIYELGGINGKWEWDGDEVSHSWN